MIEVFHLTKKYGDRTVVKGVSFRASPGEVTGFLGPNGAGKTTIMRMLSGFAPPTSGRALVAGYDVFDLSMEVRKRIGYLPENVPLYQDMTALNYLMYIAEIRRLDHRRERALRLLDDLGLRQRANSRIRAFSKGMRQRVGLASVLIHAPQVLILDEPTAGLDPAQITEVRKLIAGLADEKTVLLSTHILPEVEKTCQDVIIISGGRIAAAGTPDELKSRAREGTRVVVEVRADAGEVRKALSSVAGVASVEVETAEAWSIARVGVKPGAPDVRPGLGEAIAGRGWVVRSMGHELTSLEEYFVEVTASERPAA